MSITDFLNARIKDDEAVARAAMGDDGGSDEGFSKQYETIIDPPSGIGIAQGGFGEAAARMIATYAVPARILAECEAKRAIVELASDAGGMDSTLADEDYGYQDIEDKMLRTLAAVYSDHPDYQAEWWVGV